MNGRWLRRVEYVSVFAAVVGSIVSAVSRQMIFASAPLSLSLFLNLINRRENAQIVERTRMDMKQLNKERFELDQKILRDIEILNQRLLALPTTPEQLTLAPVQEAFEAVRLEIDHRLAPLEAQALNQPSQVEISHLQEELRTTVTRFEEANSTFKQELKPLVTIVKHLYQRQNELEQDIVQVMRAEMQTQFAQLAYVLNQQNQQSHLLSPGFDPAPLKHEVEELKEAIIRLEQKSNNASLKQDLTILVSAVKQLYDRQRIIEQSGLSITNGHNHG